MGAEIVKTELWGDVRFDIGDDGLPRNMCGLNIRYVDSRGRSVCIDFPEYGVFEELAKRMIPPPAPLKLELGWQFLGGKYQYQEDGLDRWVEVVAAKMVNEGVVIAHWTYNGNESRWRVTKCAWTGNSADIDLSSEPPFERLPTWPGRTVAT